MLPEEVTKFIGQGAGATVAEVEKGAIKRFADAVDDANPVYWDEEYARNSRYGSLIAPPGFFGWPAKLPRGAIFQRPTDVSDAAESRGELGLALAKAGYPRGLDGGIEYEFFCPVCAGDILTVKSVIKEIVEREGKTGNMAFLIVETTYHNQNGALVAIARATTIQR